MASSNNNPAFKPPGIWQRFKNSFDWRSDDVKQADAFIKMHNKLNKDSEFKSPKNEQEAKALDILKNKNNRLNIINGFNDKFQELAKKNPKVPKEFTLAASILAKVAQGVEIERSEARTKISNEANIPDNHALTEAKEAFKAFENKRNGPQGQQQLGKGMASSSPRKSPSIER